MNNILVNTNLFLAHSARNFVLTHSARSKQTPTHWLKPVLAGFVGSELSAKASSRHQIIQEINSI